MEKWIKRTIDFASGLSFTGRSDPSVIPFVPSKLKVSGKEKKYFPRTRPEDVGISSGRLISLIRALEEEKSAVVHNLLCIKDGRVILECSHPGYSVNTWHLAHSMSKTVTAIAIGMLCDDGKLSLDWQAIDFFPELETSDRRAEGITVEDLLTMKSGVTFGEIGTVTSDSWCESFFRSELACDPGESFAYNSMNSYILANIVSRITG